MIYVGIDGIDADEDLSTWVDRGVGFDSSLPAE